MKRKVWIAFLISAVVVTSSSLVISYELDSPFHNSWEDGYSGQILSAMVNNGTFYLLTAISDSGLQTYHYNIYSFNLGNGKEQWEKHSLNLYGYASTLEMPSSHGPLLNLYNNTLYILAFNGTTLESTNNGYTGGFEVIMANATTGQISHNYTINPFNNQYSITMGYTMNMQNNVLVVSFVNSSFNAGYPNNSTFVVQTYSLGHQRPVLNKIEVSSIPEIGSLGNGQESVYVSNFNIAYGINGLNYVIIYGPNGLSKVYLPGKILDFQGENSIFYYNVSGPNLSIGLYYIPTGRAAQLFQLREQENPNLGYRFTIGMNSLERFFILVSTYQEHAVILPSNLSLTPYQKLIVLNMTGSVLGNYEFPANSQVNMMNSQPYFYDNVVVYTNPTSDNSGTFFNFYSSRIMILNGASGKPAMEEDYRFSANNGSSNIFPWAPPMFKGIIFYTGSSLFYELGSKIAMANVPLGLPIPSLP